MAPKMALMMALERATISVQEVSGRIRGLLKNRGYAFVSGQCLPLSSCKEVLDLGKMEFEL